MQRSGSNGLGMSFELIKNPRAIVWTFVGFSTSCFKLQRPSRRSFSKKNCIILVFSDIARHLSNHGAIKTPFAVYHGNIRHTPWGLWDLLIQDGVGKWRESYKLWRWFLSLKSRHNWEAEIKSSLVEAFSLDAVCVKIAEAKFFSKKEWQIEIKICVTHS